MEKSLLENINYNGQMSKLECYCKCTEETYNKYIQKYINCLKKLNIESEIVYDWILDNKIVYDEDLVYTTYSIKDSTIFSLDKGYKILSSPLIILFKDFNQGNFLWLTLGLNFFTEQIWDDISYKYYSFFKEILEDISKVFFSEFSEYGVYLTDEAQDGVPLDIINGSYEYKTQHPFDFSFIRKSILDNFNLDKDDYEIVDKENFYQIENNKYLITP